MREQQLGHCHPKNKKTARGKNDNHTNLSVVQADGENGHGGMRVTSTTSSSVVSNRNQSHSAIFPRPAHLVEDNMQRRRALMVTTHTKDQSPHSLTIFLLSLYTHDVHIEIRFNSTAVFVKESAIYGSRSCSSQAGGRTIRDIINNMKKFRVARWVAPAEAVAVMIDVI